MEERGNKVLQSVRVKAIGWGSLLQSVRCSFPRAGKTASAAKEQEAERYFQGIIDENKTCVAAYQGLAMVYQQQGDKDKAWAILEQGVKENAGDYRAYNALARFNANSGEQDKALANIVKSFEDIPAT